MVKIYDESDCGNAPRREILRNFLVALAQRDSRTIEAQVADDIVWALVGDRTLSGSDAVMDWVAALPEVDEVVFGVLVTHGRGASVDGVLVLTDGARLAFSHVLRFTGAAKSAKILGVNSYLIDVPVAK